MNSYLDSQYDRMIKLIVVGASSTGKTSLLRRFVDDHFVAEENPTIGFDFKIRTIQLDGKTIKIQVFDTAGNERYRSMAASYYRTGMGIIFVCDLTDDLSLYSLASWIEDADFHASPNVQKVLVGNKL